MRFIHLLLAFAVGVSAAHFKRDPPSPLDGCISDLMNQTQTLANKVESLPSDIGAAAVIEVGLANLTTVVITITDHVQVAAPFPENQSEAIMKAAQDFEVIFEQVLVGLDTNMHYLRDKAVAVRNDLSKFQAALENLIAALVDKIPAADLEEILKAILARLENSLDHTIYIYASASTKQ